MPYSRRNILQSLGALAGASLLPVDSKASGNSKFQAPMDPINIDQLINLYDFEKLAKENMTHMAYEFVSSGAADEFTVRWNREALDNLKIQTEVLNNVSVLDTKVNLFGTEIPYPILIAPQHFIN